MQARRHHRQLSMQDDRQDYNSQLRDVINAKQQQQLALACTKAQQKMANACPLFILFGIYFILIE